MVEITLDCSGSEIEELRRLLDPFVTAGVVVRERRLWRWFGRMTRLTITVPSHLHERVAALLNDFKSQQKADLQMW